MKTILILFAVLFVMAGLLNASEATLGVALIATGGVFAVLARVAQASDHHKELLAQLRGDLKPEAAFVQELNNIKAENGASL